MKFNYRGVGYDREPLKLETVEGEVVGKYRGQPVRQHYPRHIPTPQPKLYLQYRGVAYSKRPIPQDMTVEKQLAAITKSCKIDQRSKSVTNDLAEIHLNNIRRNLERRLLVAKAKGNEDLVELLEKECDELALQ
ncbi:MAG: DUF4278 domain-containing protein [Chroococcales cyanobacterium]